MPVFHYKAKRSPTEEVAGEIDADDQAAAVARLEGMGLTPVQLRPRDAGGRSSRVSTRHTAVRVGPKVLGNVPAAGLDAFTRQLASLLRARVPVLRALGLVREEADPGPLRTVLAELEEKVRGGAMLSAALARFPRLFDPLYLGLIRAGEQAGDLSGMLQELVRHRERERELRSQVQMALAYPLIVALIGGVTVVLAMVFFLPGMLDIFRDMKAELPWPTRALMAATDFVSVHGAVLLLGAGLVLALFARVVPHGRARFLLDLVKLRLPGVRAVVKNAGLARFGRTMALLVGGGVPVHEALGLAREALDNDAMRRSLRTAEKAIVEQGGALSASLARTGLFPSFMIHMLAVGEESGDLLEALEEIARVYAERAERALKIFLTVLEPALILAIGAVVGFLVFAMLLPILEMGDLAQ